MRPAQSPPSSPADDPPHCAGHASTPRGFAAKRHRGIARERTPQAESGRMSLRGCRRDGREVAGKTTSELLAEGAHDGAFAAIAMPWWAKGHGTRGGRAGDGRLMPMEFREETGDRVAI